MLYTDLSELKTVLEIDPADTSEDTKLNFFVAQASAWIEELLNRPGMTYKSRTEFYKGTGTQKLTLRSRPVYSTPTIQVYEDNAAYFGSATGAFDPTLTQLTYGIDFCLQIDQEDGVSSRSGILLRINDIWTKPQVRQFGLLSPFIEDDPGSLKVVYSAGYLVDNLPTPFRLAANTLIAEMRYLFPLGMPIASESYEERSIAMMQYKDYLLTMIRPMLMPFRNWKF